MKALVTGGTGFLGTALVERLVAHGVDDLKCLVRPGSDRSRLEALAKKHPEAKLELFTGSLASVEAAEAALAGCGVVYHVAAAMGGAPADMFLNTVVASRNLAEAAMKADELPRIVLVSSFGVYGVADLPAGAMVDESTPLEDKPAQRDPYSQSKLKQEELFWRYHKQRGLPLVVLRPGVIYGPRGSAFSSRVGLNVFGLFLHLGGKNVLPLSYVDNCAEAIVVASRDPKAVGEAYNVVDDDLVTAAEYLRRYKRETGPMRSLRLPYPATMLMSKLVKGYHAYSKGQLPAVFTPYKTATSWKGNTFSNAKLKSLGWRPIVSTDEGLTRTFTALKAKRAAA